MSVTVLYMFEIVHNKTVKNKEMTRHRIEARELLYFQSEIRSVEGEHGEAICYHKREGQ